MIKPEYRDQWSAAFTLSRCNRAQTDDVISHDCWILSLSYTPHMSQSVIELQASLDCESRASFALVD